MIFAALIPTLLKAIMGSGAVAIPAMTGAAGAAGAAGGTVGGAAPAIPASGPPADMADAAGRISPTVGSGAAGGGVQTGIGGTNPLQLGPGGKYGGTEGVRSASQISGVPDDWMPYKVPKTGFGRFAQRLGGADPAAGNARFIANKQQFGMEKAMQMEQDARASADKFNLQEKDQQFQSGENQKRTQAERDLERDRRGFAEKQRLATLEWSAKNDEYKQRMDRMHEQADKYGGSYDPIVQQDYAQQVRDAQLSKLYAPVGLTGGGVWDPQTDMIGMPDRGSDPKLIGFKPGTTEPITTPSRPPGFVFTPRGVSTPTMIPPQGMGGGGMPAVDPSRLQYLPPTSGAAPQAAAQESFFDSILKRISGGRPNMYSAPR